MIRLSVPGTLAYRDVVLRVVASSCKLVRPPEPLQEAGQGELGRDEFEAHVVSACGEAFNNIAIHGYRDREPDTVDVEVHLGEGSITVKVMDRGQGFDPTEQAPRTLEPLPESGMGLHIIRSFMDDVTYSAGNPPATPNVLTLTKRYARAD